MTARARFILAVCILALLMTGPFVATAGLVWLEAAEADRARLIEVIAPHLPLGALMTIMGFAIGMAVVRNLFRHYVQGLLRMEEHLKLMLGANREFRVKPKGPPEVQALAHAVNALAQQRDVLMQDVEAQIALAKR